MDKIIRVIDTETGFEYASLIVPEDLVYKVETNIKKMAEKIYHSDEETIYESIYDYIKAAYKQYIDPSPRIIKIG